jgi:hypothetical protein
MIDLTRPCDGCGDIIGVGFIIALNAILPLLSLFQETNG